MQIGDQVRFLNEIGGGRVTGFQGRDIVLIEDQDGFDIPMLRSQVVVIETNENNFVRKKKEEKLSTLPKEGAVHFGEDIPQPEFSKPKERKGGDLLNVCLAFVPEDSRELTNTRFEAYLINDSNYFISVLFANNEGAAWHARWQATLEPNTKLLIETFDRPALNDFERLNVQLIAWKQDKPFMLKPAVSVELRLNLVKFYKLHVFQPSPFFREPALIYDIVRDDRPIRQVFVEAEEVLDAMRGVERPAYGPAREEDNTPSHEDEAQIPTDQPSFSEEPEVVVPVRTREEEREALKAAKRALKAEMLAKKKKEQAQKAERNPHESKPNLHPEKNDIIEVDLHINALLDNINGLSPSVLLNTQLTEFRIIMDRNRMKKGQRIVFIHGKGEGVLREALIKELTHRYRSCTYEDASFQKYGFGATMVTIH
ncbi:MAG: DUF2027 domain-containing protein [Bacteroidaceae bacterium]|nr:DUF2027 domain-containing protein [Bacteroidaceae bacterium]